MKKRGCAALCVLLVLALTGCAQKDVTLKNRDAVRVQCDALQSENGGSYTFSGPLTLDFSGAEPAVTPFNRFELSYGLDVPVRGSISYRLGKKDHTEEFFLTERADSFSQLIDGFLEGKSASALLSLTFEPLQGKTCTLRFEGVELGVQKVPGDVVTLENDRYRLGIKLSWGGGICSLEDLASPRTGFGSLLNCHDTGRLVQQSYYGGAEIPGYKNGRFNNAVWPYNPVQGGDQYGNKSKIVALTIEKDSVSVVSRPLDWALKDTPTLAYYTNTYTLGERTVRVDNTVIDFSGYPHTARTQELPAFYTVSALDRFVYYGGREPWTGGGLTIKEDLGFWGSEPGCSFSLSPANTETWCAWVDADGYGVGLYTPNIESFVAGRYKHDGSADPQADSTDYVAPLATLTLPFDRPLSYSYLVAAGTAEELRAAFAAQKDFAANTDLHETLGEDYTFEDIRFESEKDLAYLSSPNQTSVALAGGCAVLTAAQTRDSDPYVGILYSQSARELAAGDYPWLVLTYRTDPKNSAAADRMELFFACDELRSAAAGHSQIFPLETDGQFHALKVPLSARADWEGRINQIRLDYFSAAKKGDTFYLFAVSLEKDESSADAAAEEQLAEAAASAG